MAPCRRRIAGPIGAPASAWESSRFAIRLLNLAPAADPGPDLPARFLSLCPSSCFFGGSAVRGADRIPGLSPWPRGCPVPKLTFVRGGDDLPSQAILIPHRTPRPNLPKPRLRELLNLLMKPVLPTQLKPPVLPATDPARGALPVGQAAAGAAC
eukprot:10992752-Heterocapsa_arctica.AAC.1